MTMNVCWVAITRVRWSRARWFSLGWCSLAAMSALAFAAEPETARLGHGVNAYDLHDYGTAVQSLRGLQIKRLPDYTAYYLAWSELLSGSPEAAVKTLDAYRPKAIESSPLAGKIAVLHARALVDLKQPAAATRAIEILNSANIIPQPEGAFILGMAYEGAGDRLNAVLSYRKAYYEYPVTDFAIQSQVALERLRGVMGSNFPAASPAERLARARHLLELRDYRTATAEYNELAGSLPEPARTGRRPAPSGGAKLARHRAGGTWRDRSIDQARAQQDHQQLYDQARR